MLPQSVPPGMLDPTQGDADIDAGREALVDLHTTTIDVLKGYEKMVETAEPHFRPTVQRFLDLHARHAEALERMLVAKGAEVDADGSLMGTINRVVVGMRAFFDEIDEDVLGNIKDGEDHVLNAFDDVLNSKQTPEDATALSAMRDELVSLLQDVVAGE
jgi:uncharacterized protein (TIGR02284 family)